jgi:transposase
LVTTFNSIPLPSAATVFDVAMRRVSYGCIRSEAGRRLAERRLLPVRKLILAKYRHEKLRSSRITSLVILFAPSVCNREIESRTCYQWVWLRQGSDCLHPSQELELGARSRVLRAGDVRRARLILMLSEGRSWSTIEQALGCSSAFIARWQGRFQQQRLGGLFARHRGRPAQKRTPRLVARIQAWTRHVPSDGSTHWSSRKLARALGVNHMMVARVCAGLGLSPSGRSAIGLPTIRTSSSKPLM